MKSTFIFSTLLTSLHHIHNYILYKNHTEHIHPPVSKLHTMHLHFSLLLTRLVIILSHTSILPATSCIAILALLHKPRYPTAQAL